MKNIILILSVLFVSKSALAEQDKLGLIGSYLQIKNALVKSDAVTAQEEAASAYKNLKTVKEFSKKDSFLKLLKRISGTTDIEKQRKALAEFSIMLWVEIKADKTITMKLYYDYCPMKDMYWISEFEAIKNPYYGNKMLNCGSIKETKN